MYRIFVPLKDTSSPYIFNYNNIFQPTLITPSQNLEISFPNKTSEVHMMIDPIFFEKSALLNNFPELLIKDKLFLYSESFLPIYRLMLEAINIPQFNLEIYFKLIIERFFEIHSLDMPVREDVYSHKSLFKLIFPYLRENIHKDLSVTEMCEFLCMSRRPFEITFKKYTNMSPAQYFKNMKMMAIRNEIRKNKILTIGEILQVFNISHAGHFGQYYKKYFNENMLTTRQNR